jgi:hypothetical protein
VTASLDELPKIGAHDDWAEHLDNSLSHVTAIVAR